MRNYMNREHMLLPLLFFAKIKIILITDHKERTGISYEYQEKINSNRTDM